jgi:hypothetical protein
MEASKIFAEKAQTSAENMEEMTRNMEKLTEKTTKETVSMKIITLVTMFFLPGTFISVRFSSSFLQWILTVAQTLMSTDIVTFPNGAKDATISSGNTSLGALKLFFSLCVPLMAVTFGAWWGFYIHGMQKH